jgi:hypothetical protein
VKAVGPHAEDAKVEIDFRVGADEDGRAHRLTLISKSLGQSFPVTNSRLPRAS